MSMFIERIKILGQQELCKVFTFWSSTKDRNLFVRIVLLVRKITGNLFHRFSFRIKRIIRKLSSILKRIRIWAQQERLKVFTFWSSTKDRNLFVRIVLLVRKITGNLFHRFSFRIKRIIRKPSSIRFVRRLKTYEGAIRFLTPLNRLLVVLRKNAKYKDSVLHISYMVHIPYYTTRLLRKFGMKADYLAMENGSPVWDDSDYLFLPSPIPFRKALQEFYFFWTVVAKYEFIHCHFGRRLTQSGWELPLLKRLGRKIIVHYRGCEIRDRERIIEMHPECNICQDCDYNAIICTDQVRADWCRLARQYGDLFLVTTPDMKDFVGEAIHFPFFLPQIKYEEYAAPRDARPPRKEFKIVHVTGHPGIEGTKKIQTAMDRLKEKGYPIHFVALHRVSHHQALREMADADLTIGKMKMGYYANAQIESMFLGVPAITHVRPEFVTPELENSGFILTTLNDLATTLEYYLKNPAELEKKRRIARSSILRLHDDEALGKRMVELYRGARKEGRQKFGKTLETGERLYRKMRRMGGRIYRNTRAVPFWFFKRFLGLIFFPAWSILSKYLSGWWKLSSGRYGFEMREKLEKKLGQLPPVRLNGSPRIFHGLYHTPQPVFIKNAFRDMGLTSHYEILDVYCPAFPMVDAHHRIYHPDIYREHIAFQNGRLIRCNPPITTPANLSQLEQFFLERWGKYDVFQFNWFLTFLPDNLDVEFLRRSGRLVYFHFHGCWVLESIVNQFTERGESVVEACQYCQSKGWRDEYFDRFYRGVEHSNRVFTSTPNLCHCSRDFEYLPNSLERELDLIPSPLPRSKARSEPIVIGHAPFSEAVYEKKGTPHILKAVETLKREGWNIEFKLIKNLSRTAAIGEYEKCDIFVEQLNAGSYGSTAIEAMAQGVPVISSHHPAHAHLAPNCPVIHADPLTVTERLRELLDDADRRAEIGRKSYEWRKYFHSTDKIAGHLLRIYREDFGLQEITARNNLQNRNPRYGDAVGLSIQHGQ